MLTLVSSLATKTHRTLHHLETDETMVRRLSHVATSGMVADADPLCRVCTYARAQVPVFTTDTNGGSPKSKYIMGRRNWCGVRWDPASGDLVFDIRVEKDKGHGQTVGCVVPVVA